jgi:hypothetical protein
MELLDSISANYQNASMSLGDSNRDNSGSMLPSYKRSRVEKIHTVIQSLQQV